MGEGRAEQVAADPIESLAVRGAPAIACAAALGLAACAWSFPQGDMVDTTFPDFRRSIMHMEIGGVRVRVIELTQRHVYADVIEGVPNAQINRDIVERTVQRTNGPTHLVAPAQRRVSADPKSDKQSLPPIACSARVRGPAQDADAEHAEAWIVWFQDVVSTTVAPEAAKALQTVRWHDIATDEYW